MGFGIGEAIVQAVLTIILLIFAIITGVIFLYFKYRQDEEKTIPPLDMIDAKKLDDMVVRQVEEALKPILLSKGYAEEQIKEILTRTSGRGQTFRR